MCKSFFHPAQNAKPPIYLENIQNVSFYVSVTLLSSLLWTLLLMSCAWYEMLYVVSSTANLISFLSTCTSCDFSLLTDYLCTPDENIYNIDFTRFKIRDIETGTVLFEITKPPSTGESLNCCMLGFTLTQQPQ